MPADGRPSLSTQDGGPAPGGENSSLTFPEAFHRLVEEKSIGWVACLADDDDGDCTDQAMEVPIDSLPAPARAFHDRLLVPRNPGGWLQAEVEFHEPDWFAAAVPGTMPFDPEFSDSPRR